MSAVSQRMLVLWSLLTGLAAADAVAQCLLANPSFEIAGAAGAAFGGWSQAGDVTSSAAARHGQAAARLRGLDTGGWNESACWQDLTGLPGETWSAGGQVRHSPDHPLTGASVALVRLEWRDGSGALIGSREETVLDGQAPADSYLPFTVPDAQAPPGTSRVRLVLGVRQAPGQPPPEACFDEVTLRDTSPPTINDVQWTDFPGGRVIEFSGRAWRVKGPGWYGPGPNVFSDQPECVFVDDAGRLHLAIRHLDGIWRSSEVTLVEPLGYGDHVFTTSGDLDLLDDRAVLGLFLWQYETCYDPANAWWNPYNEIDVEVSRWGNAQAEAGQFVAQPWDWEGNLERFAVESDEGGLASFAFNWLPDRVEFRSWRGGAGDESPETLVRAWTYVGPHLPRPDQPRVHLNLWRMAEVQEEQEVVLTQFLFTPAEDPTGPLPPRHLPRSALRLGEPVPNPFNPRASLRLALDMAGQVDVAVYDLAGRRIRTLLDGVLPAGDHTVWWNGRDSGDRACASGIYFCVLRQGGAVAVQRMLLLH